MPYVLVWEFQARPGREAEFERAYGPQGVWAEMFARAPGFGGVQLLRCAERPGRYLTIDRWESKAAFEGFRARFGDAYDTLDRTLEGLAELETRIGAFTA